MNFHKLFYDDVREKKYIGSNIHSRKGKRGYVGKLYLTSDLLKGKEKRKYQKSSKVVQFNMYDTIMAYQDFQQLDDTKKKKIIEEYRKRFANTKIMKEWGLDEYHYYTKLLKKLGVQTKTPNRKARRTKQQRISPVLETQTTSASKLVEKENSGMNLKIKGNYSSDKIQSKLEKLAFLLEEDTKYEISIQINECN